VRARWFNQPERGTLFAVKLIRWIALHVGRWAARPLLYPITAYFALTAAEQRRASRTYLRRVLHREPGLSDMARHFHCFAATILDRIFMITGDQGRFDLNVHGVVESFGDEQPRGGCILLGSHIGSFEVMRMLAVAHGEVRLKVLMYEEHNAGLTGLLHELNPDFAHMVISLGRVDALLSARESLHRGEMLGILGDRVAESDKTTR
jgi:predicted LPLAT superfamily acyltransferase